MQIYKLKAFARFQRREAIADVMLSLATRRAEDGLVDADLGGGLVKQRVARRGQGKSGGYRTILAYRRGTRAIFLFGFAKSERANLDDEELNYWRKVGEVYLALNEAALERAMAAGELMEVRYGEKR